MKQIILNDDKKHGGLIVIEEIWGVDAHIKDVMKRFAAEGYNVASPELLAETGMLEKLSPAIFAEMKDPAKSHEAQAKYREVTQPMHAPDFAPKAIAKLQETADYLLSLPNSNGKVAVLGFCFGGTYAFQLAIHDTRIKACIPLYGQPPMPLESVEKISCPVLALYGEKDERLMQTLPELDRTMKKYGKDFEFKVYKNTGHAFFNNTRHDAYNKEAATDAWQKALALLHETIA